MKRIIHVISDSNIGGAGKYLLNYLENCNRNLFDVKVVVPRDSKLIVEIKKLDFEFFEIDGLAEQSFSKTALKQLKPIFKSENPDIVHAHACLSARIAGKMCGIKTIYTRHTDSPPGKKLINPIGRAINGLVNGFLADGIIAVSNMARENLLKTGISDKKIRVIYNGVSPIERITDGDKLKKIYDFYGIEYNAKIVAIVARLEEIKGHEYFIDTAKIVAEQGYDAKFVIAGTGSREEFLKEYALKTDNVIFLGFVDDVSKLNNIMYLQVNASSYEALGLSVIEGMRIGVPAVVSNCGGNAEVTLNDVNGYVVNGQNPVEFAEKIVMLLNDKALYERLSAGAIKIFNEKFTASAMAENTEKYYMEILEV